MKSGPFLKVRAFILGAAAASLGIAILDVVHAQVVSGPTVYLCFGAEGTEVRAVQPKVPCKPGERMVQVKQPDPKQKEEAERNSRVEALKDRLSALEERERLGRLVPTRVVAPFEVIDRNKQRILRIDEQSVTAYNEAGQILAWIVADRAGGELQIERADGAKSGTLSARDQKAHLLLEEGTKPRIELGRRIDGRYGLKIFSKTGPVVAYMGQSDMGNGLIFIAGKDGKRGAEAYSDDNTNTGFVTVKNTKGLDVGSLYSDADGAGRLRLTNAEGEIHVNAGVTEGRGVVQTGPGMRHSGVGILGLVPSYILGNPAD
jgi:hypothetical protein